MSKSNPKKRKPLPNYLLKKARELRGWTHEDVANLIKLPDPGMVSRWERGVTFPRPRYRQALANLFGMSLEDLGLVQNERYHIAQTNILATNGQHIEPLYKIPRQVTSFIGREQDIIDVCALLTRNDVQLVTVLGPAGIGKTRLGIQIATHTRDRFSDGICFISLATVSDLALLVSAVAHELDIREYETVSLVEQVKEFLREKEFLLVLDNFEHIMAAVPFVADIIDSSPHLKVLVTSREALHLQAEQRFTLSSLPLPDPAHASDIEFLRQYDAITLFEHRAQSYMPTFQVTSQNARAIVELCSHLDGLPLAIELAASRINLLSPQAILSRISQRFQILKSDTYAVPERQRTLYNTIKWSYDLLSPLDQWLFRHLSIFANGVSLETLETFFAIDKSAAINILDGITSLLNKSLIRCITSDTTPSLQIELLETMREYGLDCLRTNGELEECQHSHAMYYFHLIENAVTYLTGMQQDQWLRMLEREKGNLSVALHWLIDHNEIVRALHFCEAFGKFCGLQGYWSEEQHWLKIVLGLPQILEAKAIHARVLRRAGHLAYRLRDLVSARKLQEESVAHSREIGDKQNLAGALSGLGWILYRQDEINLAGQFLHESMEVARASGDIWTLANSLESLGRFMYCQGKIDEAYSHLEESIALSRKLLDKETIARTLTTFVAMEIAQGHLQKAAAFAQESFDLAQELGTKPIIALALQSLGDVALFQKEYELAKKYFEESVDIARDLGDEAAIIQRQIKLVDIALAQKDFETVNTFLEEEFTLFYNRQDIPEVVIALQRFQHYIEEERKKDFF